MPEINIGKQIAYLRKTKGITQEQLSLALNVSSQAVSKWETSLCCPDITLIPDIAVFFDVTADELLGVNLLRNENFAQLAEHLIEMSVISYKNGLLALCDYSEKAVRFPFLKTAVEIAVTSDQDNETSSMVLIAAAGDDRSRKLIADCVNLIAKGTHTAEIIKILENRLSCQENSCLKEKRPDFFPTKDDFFKSLAGRKPLSENTALLEKLLSFPDSISVKGLFFPINNELFPALYGASENVIKMISNALIDKSAIFHLAWNFKLFPAPSEAEIVDCQQKIYRKIVNIISNDNK